MKSIVNNNTLEPKVKPFPKLMINPNCDAIWLVFSKNIGTLVSVGGSLFSLGETCTTLCIDNHKDFEGSVTLSND